MNRWFRLLTVYGLLGATGLAAPDIRVVAGIAEEGKALVGQRRTYYIEVQTDTWFSGPIEIIPPSLDGIILVQLEAFGLNGTQRQNGTTYTTHRKEFTLFALNPGTMVIPAGQVRAQIADPGNPVISYTGESPETVFAAVMPDGVDWEGPLLTTRSLTLEESWDQPPGSGSVGDAFQRTITMEADDIMGMVFPPIPEVDLEGVRVYRDAPQVEDKTGRGGLRGSRIETLTYVFEKPGQVVLPAFSLFWWDESTATLKEERLPEYLFEVAPLSGRDETSETAIPASEGGGSGRSIHLGWVLLVLFGLATGAFLLRKRILGLFHGSEDPEPELFSTLLETLDQGDAPSVYRACRAWLDGGSNAPIEPGAPVLDLERAAVGYTDEFDRQALRVWLLQQRERQLTKRSAREMTLPDLNP